MQSKAKAGKTLASDIVEVFSDNFFEELQRLTDLSLTYNYIGMVSNFLALSTRACNLGYRISW